MHDKIIDQLSADAALRNATLIVRYERLCEHPADTLQALFSHCKLGLSEAMLNDLASRVQHPTYYEPNFTDAERQLIDDITGPVAERFDGMGGSDMATKIQTTDSKPASSLSHAG